MGLPPQPPSGVPGSSPPPGWWLNSPPQPTSGVPGSLPPLRCFLRQLAVAVWRILAALPDEHSYNSSTDCPSEVLPQAKDLQPSSSPLFGILAATLAATLVTEHISLLETNPYTFYLISPHLMHKILNDQIRPQRNSTSVSALSVQYLIINSILHYL